MPVDAIDFKFDAESLNRDPVDIDFYKNELATCQHELEACKIVNLELQLHIKNLQRTNTKLEKSKLNAENEASKVQNLYSAFNRQHSQLLKMFDALYHQNVELQKKYQDLVAEHWHSTARWTSKKLTADR